MSSFFYTALDKTDNYVRGQINASSIKQAARLLEGQGLMVVNLKSEKKINQLVEKLNNISTISRVDRMFFTRHLYTLLESGISLDQATKIVAEQASNLRFKAIINDIHSKVTGGQTLYSALSSHKKYFSDFYINLVRVGERSGTLDESLLHLLEQQEKDYELVTKARGSLIYPGILITAAISVVILMMTFVVPTISDLLLEYGVDLPLATKIMVFTSNALINYGIYMLIFTILLALLLIRLIRTPKGKWWWEEFLLAIPVIKQIIKEFNLARFARSMSSLLLSGVAIDEALILSAYVCKNSHYQKTIEGSVAFVRKGIPLTEVLSGHSSLYPAITTRMIEVGEKTGKLDHMYEKVAAFYEKSVTNTLQNLSSIIEPVLILCIGSMVAFIAVSILTPIWKFAQTV